MNHCRAAVLVCAGGFGFAAAVGAHADADEAWLHRAELPADMQPLLVLLLDTSDAASGVVTTAPAYDPATDYSASVPTSARCDPSRVYWRRGPGPAPDCALQAGLEFGGDGAERGFHCDAARDALARFGYFIASRAAQWRGAGRWSSLDRTSAGAVECRADRGRHGAVAGDWYASDDATSPWTDEIASEIRWDRPPYADPHVFFIGNYLNYLQAALPQEEISIARLMRRRLSEALRGTDNLAVAIMRFAADGGADGSYVSSAAATAVQAATLVESMVNSAPPAAAPLGEMLSEAAAWLTGSAVRFGRSTAADPSAFVVSGVRYRSPFEHACRPVTLALITAGEPSGDESAAGAAEALPGFTEATGGCNDDCIDALARYLQSSDLLTGTPGQQSASLLWIVPSARSGSLHGNATADAVASVEDPLSYANLIAHAHQLDAAIPGGPAVSAAAFDLTATDAGRPGLIYAMTAPRPRERWLGNAFRYGLGMPGPALAPPLALDRDGEPALSDATGLPRPGSRSEWSDSPDADLLAGGVSGRLPPATARRLFTELASTDIVDPRNRLSADNRLIDRSLLGLDADDSRSPGDVIDWLLSVRPIGDPGIRAPTIVEYPEADLTLAFIASQDGSLHAFDAASGVERWAWFPRALMPRLADLMRAAPTTARSHGIDGALVVNRFDPNGDGTIDVDAGEHLWLMFGLGRGGSSYYALDIASPDAPRLLWSRALGAGGSYPGSEPVIARLATERAWPGGDWIAILADGSALRLLDATTGDDLWSAAGDGAVLEVPGLPAMLASAPRILDLDGDRQLDRAYLLDASGGLWRFDFAAGAAPAGLASARRIARLGGGTRYFESSPDISVANINGRREIAIAAGSGRLDRPRDGVEIDRVYVVFDRGGSHELTDPDLHDATDGEWAMPATSPGWYLRLDRHGNGEKVVGSPITFDHVLRFQTYQPVAAREDEPCGPPRALHRMHARDVRTGLPAGGIARQDDEEAEFEAAGLPVELRFVFPAAADASCTGCRARPFGIAGARIFDPGYAGDPVRTSWRELRIPADSR